MYIELYAEIIEKNYRSLVKKIRRSHYTRIPESEKKIADTKKEA